MASIETNYNVAPLGAAAGQRRLTGRAVVRGRRHRSCPRPARPSRPAPSRPPPARSARFVARPQPPGRPHPPPGGRHGRLRAAQRGRDRRHAEPSTAPSSARRRVRQARRRRQRRSAPASGDDRASRPTSWAAPRWPPCSRRGDFWAAYFGTVTYAHDNVVVAFGHPADLDGASGLDMANADVYGIWSDSMRRTSSSRWARPAA